MTASCHSNGIDNCLTQSSQYSRVWSWNSREMRETESGRLSSEWTMKVIGCESTKGLSLATCAMGASVVRRIEPASVT
jgi:hypothetical protein